ncbi:hypothetical protein H2509_08700 [Stappia sp. F7233]|uniref:Methyltransferase n=1 Tax=Stappia albiluteola TaxID=2758565 RepID=A0A839AE15_9HYPH|nr:isoprenylcysteine carboxylmethyltransferase family protein [Stappia albiluteola]MBA5777204.1 hypothetical protein [Stappia albiluteola]
MPEAVYLLGFLTLQRLAELVWAQSNTRRLMEKGGVEFGRSHYPGIVALHGSWLLGLWVLGHAARVEGFFLVLFAILQIGRLWVLLALGRRWTTRIIVIPGEELVARGPFRLMRHPNYAIVAAEIAVVPLALGLPAYALVFSALNLLLLAKRIRVEDAALAWAKSQA